MTYIYVCSCTHTLSLQLYIKFMAHKNGNTEAYIFMLCTLTTVVVLLCVAAISFILPCNNMLLQLFFDTRALLALVVIIIEKSLLPARKRR